MLEDTIDKLRNHDAVVKIDGSEQYYHVHITEYGNARALNLISEHSFGNFTIVDDKTAKFNIRKD